LKAVATLPHRSSSEATEIIRANLLDIANPFPPVELDWRP
jgi:hypothetical protein